MGSLTKEDKARIKEEERYREKVREEEQYRLKLKKSGNKKKSSLPVWILFIILLFVPVLISVNYLYPQSIETEPLETATTTQTASVVGKHAFNKTNGLYRGKIIKVKPCGTNTKIMCYVVEDPENTRTMEAPVDNTDVRDTR